MKNGRADDEENDPKIARIEEARRRRQLGLGGGQPASKGASRRATGSVKEWLVGAVIVAMAVGFLLHLARPLWQGALTAGP